MTQCLTCTAGYLYYSDTLGSVRCVRFCPDNFTHYRAYSYNASIQQNNTVQNVTLQRDQCVPCPNNCLTCNPNNICIYCISGYFYHKGSCVSSCPGGYFNQDSNCLLCHSNCTTCNSLGCTACVDGFVLQNNRCYRTCTNSTTLLVSATDTCNVSCISPCLTCFGLASNACLTCQSNYYLFFGFCMSSCPSGYSSINGACTLCPQGCG
jgi:hypothetical protein